MDTPAAGAQPKTADPPSSQSRRLGNSKLRHRLLRDLVLLIVLSSGALLTIAALVAAQARKDLAWTYIQQTMAQASREFADSFAPVTRVLLFAQEWGLSGQLDGADIRSVNARFIPILQQMPKVSGLMLADTTGRELFLFRQGDAWVSRSIPAESGQPAEFREWSTPEQAGAARAEELDYDPRTRPWFKGALALTGDARVFWSSPYLFYTQQALGITAAVRWADPEQPDIVQVLALDLLLDDVVNAVARIRASEGGKIFLFNSDGAVYIPEREERPGLFSDHSAFFASSGHPGGIAVFDAVHSWQSSGKPMNHPLSFVSGGSTWWGNFRPLYPDNQFFWFGVAVPESDFLGAAGKRWLEIGLASLLLLLGVIWLAFRIVRRYSHQLKELPKLSVDKNDFENEVFSLIRMGESATLEFKSTMRMNLRTGRAGKEIELAWLKAVVGFMNTDGGILLIGVSDDGEILGLEADGFENDDKCRLHFKNLFNQHIGLEYSKFVRFHLQPVAGKTVLAIECQPCPDPVFLSKKNEEGFYIRSGPSSVELSISKALQYLRSRG